MTLDVLITLQAVQVVILWVHDWLPLGPLNDVRSVQAEDTRTRLVVVTLIQSVPYTLGLLFTVAFRETHHPMWVWDWLWVSYLLLFAGELRAWWLPYLLRAEPERAARYEKMFGGTHAFLPIRNGIVPNTLHCVLHAATACTLLALCVVSPHSFNN
jgi:hypothetical protein